MYGFIYLTVCTINNKKYVGMCSHEDVATGKYLGSGTILKNSIKRYGKSNFTRKILEECATRAELEKAEIKWINYYNAVNNKEFYNISAGGHGGDSDTVRNVWKNRTAQERKEIGNKISKTRKEQGLAKGSNNPMYNKHTSQLVTDVWNNRSKDQRQAIGNKISKTRKEQGLAKGSNNPMYGRSAITEKKLRWYTNGKENKYITEGTQPKDFVRGRTNLSGRIGKKVK